MPDINFLIIKMDNGNNSVFVSDDVKSAIIIHLVRRVERRFYVRETRNRSGLYDLSPRLQWRMGWWVDG